MTSCLAVCLLFNLYNGARRHCPASDALHNKSALPAPPNPPLFAPSAAQLTCKSNQAACCTGRAAAACSTCATCASGSCIVCSSLMLCDDAGACGACCSYTPSSAKPPTARCLAAESCVRCGDGRCHGKRTSADMPTRPCFASRLSSSSKLASRHTRPRAPQAITLSDPTPLPTDLLLSVSICAGGLACRVCMNKYPHGRLLRSQSCPVQLQSRHIGCQHRTCAACTDASVMQHTRGRFMMGFALYCASQDLLQFTSSPCEYTLGAACWPLQVVGTTL